MPPDVQYYDALLDRSPIDSESVTYFLVSGATREEVAAALGADLTVGAIEPDSEELLDDQDHSAYAFAEVTGGVLAMETTGFADPSNATLRELSRGGRTAAVARSNILGHVRFGYARNGEIVFDENEYMYVEDFDAFPEEVRELAELTWDDLEGDLDDDGPDGLAVAMAMAVQVTGVTVTADDLVATYRGGFFRTPSLVYSSEE
jgi:hypothetical protein